MLSAKLNMTVQFELNLYIFVYLKWFVEFFEKFIANNPQTVLAQSLAFTEQIKKLGEGIELLNKELQKQVLENHHDLLRQANHANKLESVLNGMNIHIQNLFANAERLRVQVILEYKWLHYRSLAPSYWI